MRKLLILTLSLVWIGSTSMFSASVEDKPRLPRVSNPESLYKYDPDQQEQRRILIEYQENENPKYRRVATRVLSRSKDDSVVPYLKEALNDDDLPVQRHAAEGLLRFGYESLAYDNLERLANEGDSAALAAFTVYDKKGFRFRDKRGRDIVTRSLECPSPNVQVYAAQLLVGTRDFPDKVYDVLSSLMENREEKIKMLTIEVLQRIGNDRARAVLINSESKHGKKVNRRIKEALKNIGK